VRIYTISTKYPFLYFFIQRRSQLFPKVLRLTNVRDVRLHTLAGDLT